MTADSPPDYREATGPSLETRVITLEKRLDNYTYLLTGGVVGVFILALIALILAALTRHPIKNSDLGPAAAVVITTVITPSYVDPTITTVTISTSRTGGYGGKPTTVSATQTVTIIVGRQADGAAVA